MTTEAIEQHKKRNKSDLKGKIKLNDFKLIRKKTNKLINVRALEYNNFALLTKTHTFFLVSSSWIRVMGIESR